MFEQFEEPEELAFYRSVSLRLPPAPRFDTPVDDRRIKFFQGWEFEEFDFRYVPPLVWQEPLCISPLFPLVDLLDPGYHVPELEQVHQDFRNFYPEPIRSPSPLEKSVDWTYVCRHLLEQEIFRSGFSTPLTSSFVGITNDPYRALLPNAVQDIIREGINLGIEQQGDRRHRSDSRERDISKRRRITSELSSSSSTFFPSHSPSPPPIPIGIKAYQLVLVISTLLYVDQNTLGSLHVTASSKVSVKFVCREFVEAYRRDQAVESEIERELETHENQENIPLPAYVAPELPAANRTNQAGPRLVFGRLPLPVLPVPEGIRIHRDALPERPRTPIPVFCYHYDARDFLAPGQETDARSRNTSEVASSYQTPDADLADVE